VLTNKVAVRNEKAAIIGKKYDHTTVKKERKKASKKESMNGWMDGWMDG